MDSTRRRFLSFLACLPALPFLRGGEGSRLAPVFGPRPEHHLRDKIITASEILDRKNVPVEDRFIDFGRGPLDLATDYSTAFGELMARKVDEEFMSKFHPFDSR